MHARDVRLAALRGILCAAGWAVVVAVFGVVGPAALLLLLVALVVPVPLALVELGALRARLRGASSDVFGRTWVAATVLVPVVLLQVAYADALLAGGSVEQALARAGGLTAEALLDPAWFLLAVMSVVLGLPFGLAAGLRHDVSL